MTGATAADGAATSMTDAASGAGRAADARLAAAERGLLPRRRLARRASAGAGGPPSTLMAAVNADGRSQR
jgi:hypothetical protein